MQRRLQGIGRCLNLLPLKSDRAHSSQPAAGTGRSVHAPVSWMRMPDHPSAHATVFSPARFGELALANRRDGAAHTQSRRHRAGAGAVRRRVQTVSEQAPASSAPKRAKSVVRRKATSTRQAVTPTRRLQDGARSPLRCTPAATTGPRQSRRDPGRSARMASRSACRCSRSRICRPGCARTPNSTSLIRRPCTAAAPKVIRLPDS